MSFSPTDQPLLAVDYHRSLVADDFSKRPLFGEWAFVTPPGPGPIEFRQLIPWIAGKRGGCHQEPGLGSRLKEPADQIDQSVSLWEVPKEIGVVKVARGSS